MAWSLECRYSTILISQSHHRQLPCLRSVWQRQEIPSQKNRPLGQGGISISSTLPVFCPIFWDFSMFFLLPQALPSQGRELLSKLRPDLRFSFPQGFTLSHPMVNRPPSRPHCKMEELTSQ